MPYIWPSSDENYLKSVNNYVSHGVVISKTTLLWSVGVARERSKNRFDFR